MTYPLREANGPRKQQQQRVKQGEPFDPEDLTRRLQAYLAEQKIRAERRRIYRAQQAALAAAAASNEESNHPGSLDVGAAGHENGYHHVPTVAASAFSRTTTPNPLRQIHALSQPAVKTHLEQIQPEHSNSKGLKKTQAIDQAMAEREMLRQRNQFQRTQSMENAAEIDGYRGVFKPQQRSFVPDHSHLAVRQERKGARPLSTGDVVDEKEGSSAGEKLRRKSKPNGFDMSERNNWTQEEHVEMVKQKEKEKSSPSMRKKPSSWILLGKRSPKSDKDKDDAGAALNEVTSPTEGRFSKSGFLARFKRHPS